MIYDVENKILVSNNYLIHFKPKKTIKKYPLFFEKRDFEKKIMNEHLQYIIHSNSSLFWRFLYFSITVYFKIFKRKLDLILFLVYSSNLLDLAY